MKGVSSMNMQTSTLTLGETALGNKNSNDLCAEYQELWHWIVLHQDRVDNDHDGVAYSKWCRMLDVERTLLDSITIEELVSLRT